jgi:hypothetical protein
MYFEFTGVEVYNVHFKTYFSVSIVSDYRLDDQGSISGRGKGFFL